MRTRDVERGAGRRRAPRARRLLRGRLRSGAVRTVAMLQVALGLTSTSENDARAAGKAKSSPADPLAGANNDTLGAWLREPTRSLRHDPAARRALARLLLDPRATTKREGESARDVAGSLGPNVPPKLTALIEAELRARNGEAIDRADDAELLAALTEAEAAGVYDGWITALLWSHTEHAPAAKLPRSRAQRRELMARLARHARASNALIRARVDAGKIEFVPWRSKAARPRHLRLGAAGAALRLAAMAELKNVDTGTWEHSATITLQVAPGARLDLVREGVKRELGPGARVRLGRLDLLETPGLKGATVVSAELGSIELPRGRQLAVWQLPDLLSEAATAQVKAQIAKALAGGAGSEAALLWIERTLPFTHRLAREAVDANPREPGAGALRMVLALFDDALVRTPPKPPIKGSFP